MRAAPPINPKCSAQKVLDLLSKRPLSTKMILATCKDQELHPFVKTFSKLRREGKIDLIGFFYCPLTGKRTPYYLSYSNPCTL